jgi:hypothetical protein
MGLEEEALRQLREDRAQQELADEEVRHAAALLRWDNAEAFPIFRDVKELVALFTKYRVPSRNLYEVVSENQSAITGTVVRRFRPVARGWTVTLTGHKDYDDFPFAITVTGLCVGNFKEQVQNPKRVSTGDPVKKVKGIARSDFTRKGKGDRWAVYLDRNQIQADSSEALGRLFKRTAVEIIAGRSRETTVLHSPLTNQDYK